MTSNHHTLMTWATHVLQWMVQRAANSRVSESKAILSSDCSLQLDYMKPESL